jgi:hypothetical protein
MSRRKLDTILVFLVLTNAILLSIIRAHSNIKYCSDNVAEASNNNSINNEADFPDNVTIGAEVEALVSFKVQSRNANPFLEEIRAACSLVRPLTAAAIQLALSNLLLTFSALSETTNSRRLRSGRTPWRTAASSLRRAPRQ